MKLSIKQLLFAHKIGANWASPSLFKKKECDDWHCYCSDEGWIPSVSTSDENEAICTEIDFGPLYDWIDHDGSNECPVREGDVVEIVLINRQDSFSYAADGVPWKNVVKFKLVNAKGKPEDWPENRADAIGQNGNTGEHYEVTHTTDHHKRPDGTDLIDDWWNEYPPEVARVLMWEQARKYNNRLGKKDPVHIEVAKMADYLRRWADKERELAGAE